MNCQDVARNQIAEQYVSGRLTDPERDAYEQHYFECPACLEELQLLQAIALDLEKRPAPRRSPVPQWAAIAAMLALALAGAWWFARHRAAPPVEVRRTAPPSTGQQLAALARIEAPPYREPHFRGGGDAAAMFRSAMKLYQSQDYAGAAAGLAQASRLDPASPAIRFFLGVSELLGGRTEEAVVDLKKVAANNDALEAADAHYYLAMAMLKKSDASEAVVELRQCVAGGSTHAAEARQLIARILEIAPAEAPHQP